MAGIQTVLRRQRRAALVLARDRRLSPESVAGITDPESRNRLITRSYWELSLRMRDLMGEEAGINWCTLAAWASRRAGRTIRKEDCNTLLGGLGCLATLGDLSAERARRAVGEGNLRVYREIAPVFARFIDWFSNGRRARIRDRLGRFLAHLRPGSVTERDAAGRPGQDLLREAFRNYARALVSRDVKRKQGHMLHANAQVALHEQHHLQDAIAGAMPASAWLRRQVTASMVDLPLPGGQSISVARDVPGGRFAPHLRWADGPGQRALMESLGVGDCPRGSASTDWSDLGQRMRFIVALLLVRHTSLEMFDRPE